MLFFLSINIVRFFFLFVEQLEIRFEVMDGRWSFFFRMDCTSCRSFEEILRRGNNDGKVFLDL